MAHFSVLQEVGDGQHTILPSTSVIKVSNDESETELSPVVGDERRSAATEQLVLSPPSCGTVTNQAEIAIESTSTSNRKYIMKLRKDGIIKIQRIDLSNTDSETETNMPLPPSTSKESNMQKQKSMSPTGINSQHKTTSDSSIKPSNLAQFSAQEEAFSGQLASPPSTYRAVANTPGMVVTGRCATKRKYVTNFGKDMMVKIQRLNLSSQDSVFQTDTSLPQSAIEDSDRLKEKSQSLAGVNNQHEVSDSSKLAQFSGVREVDDEQHASLPSGSEIKVPNAESEQDITHIAGKKRRSSCRNIEINSNAQVTKHPHLTAGIFAPIKYIICNKCSPKFTDAEAYNKYISDHPDYKGQECEEVHVLYCRFDFRLHFPNLYTVASHLKCWHCEHVAVTERGLRRHCLSVHNDDRPFVCHLEGCSFRSKKDYQRTNHMLSVHDEQKRFKCDKCHTALKSKVSLSHHQKSCYKIKEYLCDLCGQSFNLFQYLKSHGQNVHFGEKRYKCSICSHTASHHGNLRRHMLIHEKRFPYSCPVCKQQFRHSNSLKSHVATKHKDVPKGLDHTTAVVLEAESKLKDSNSKPGLKDYRNKAKTNGVTCQNNDKSE